MDIQKEDVNFGDYCSIEQKRYGAPNEFYGYKVVNRLRSNTWIDVPVDARDNKPKRHNEVVDVVEVISCTAGCDLVERFRVSDLVRAWRSAQAVPYESCSIKSHEIIINETKSELIDGYDIAKEDEYLLESLVYRGVCIGRAQSVPKGFVLVSKNRLAEAVDGIEELFKEDCTLALGELLPIQQYLNAMIEAHEPNLTELKINWGMKCPECNHNEATCYSTATQESGYEFMDGDAVVCLMCGNKGEMNANGEDSDICWNEDEFEGMSHANDNDAEFDDSEESCDD